MLGVHTPIRRAGSGVALLALLLTLVASLTLTPSASAAPAPPTGLSPSGATISGAPTLSWTRVAGATSYQVDISDDSTFSSNVMTLTTTNRRVTPTTHLRSAPNGEIFWRVRSIGATGPGSPRSTSFFRNALAGPTLVSPAPGATLTQPTDPPILSWTPVAGAVSYTIQVDTDNSFVAPFTIDNATINNTSYLVPNPLIAQTYSWRVKATLTTGIETNWSEVRTFAPTGLTPATLQSPEDNASTKVVDVVLDWNPVPGAVRYDLQISTDQTFLSGVTTYSNLVGTRFSPNNTLGNDQYWWRVRPYDGGGNFLQWGQVPIWTFQRHWPDQTALQYPPNDAIVGDPFYYQWTAVPHASSYTIELHTSQDFEPANQIRACNTVNTTFVPANLNECWPGAAGNFYWRVVAHDGPVDVITDRIVSQVGHFQYLPSMINLGTTVPADGADVSLPTLSWDAVPNAAKYAVHVYDVTAGSATLTGVVTTGTSFTPREPLIVGHTYRWYAQTISGSGRYGAGLAPGAQNVFTVVAAAAPSADSPEPVSPANGTSFVRFPTLQWTPVVGAAYYRIGLRPAGTVQAFSMLAENFKYPAGEDLGSAYLSVGNYEWKVEAYTAGSQLLSDSQSPGSFTMANLVPPTNLTAALTGNASGSANTRCAKLLPEKCTDLRATPVLRWNPVPSVGYYKVTLSRDEEMTSIISTTLVDANMFIPAVALADSQAGAAYHWYVQPCKADSKCSPLAHANNAFNKTSNPIDLLSPAPNAVVADTITFTWRDWLETNLDTPGIDVETGINPQVEAWRYRLQVASDPGFQNVIDDRVDLDQMTYTAYDKAYPEGPLYWRVLPYDGSTNPLAWSETRMFDKQTPAATQVSPANGATTTQSAPFRWQPQAYSDRYDIEIYRNNDDSVANRIVQTQTKLVAFTPASPLAPSPSPYLWRVRAVNASNHPGTWSPLRSFRVSSSAPTQLAPVANAYLAANDAMFTWTPIQGASTYRFERRQLSSNGIAEAVGTVALAWAPMSALGDGAWEWRVLAIDPSNQVIGTSPWRGFKVDGVAPTVIATAPTGTVSRTTNFTAKFSERVKLVSSTTMKLFVAGRTSPLPAVVKLSADGRTATLNPNANLIARKTYTIKLYSGIKDVAGNPLKMTSWKVTAR